LAAVVVLLSAGCDWRSFGYNTAHFRFNASDDAPTIDEVPASARVGAAVTGGPISASPATADGVVYIASTDGKLYAFEAVAGACGIALCPLWSAPIGVGGESSPAVERGVVYVGSGDGKLYAFDAHGKTNCGGTPVTCSPLWTGATGGTVSSSPVVAANVVYVGSSDGMVYAFDARGATNCTSGACVPLWRASTAGPVVSSPAVADGVVYVGSDDGKLYAFDKDGTTNCTLQVCLPMWTGTTGGPVSSSPSFADGVVYVGSQDGVLYAFDAAGQAGCTGTPRSCQPQWTGTTGGPIASSTAVANGVVYVGSDDRHLYAFDARPTTTCTGSPVLCPARWAADTGGAVRSSPAVAESVIYVGSSDGALYAFDAGTGAQLWREDTGGAVLSSPITTDGYVYVGSTSGALNAYRPVVTPIDPSLTARPLTAERRDRYALTIQDATLTASAPNTNKGGGTRAVFSRLSDPDVADAEACATWSEQSRTTNQQGVALRVRASNGATSAITVTKNVLFAAAWIFNVHVWDTSRAQPATQIAGFDLGQTFNPNGTLVPLPWRMCAQAVGSTLSFLVWPTSVSQPAWDDPAYGGSVTLPEGYAEAGSAGWYVGHLAPGDATTFADLTANPAPPAPFAFRAQRITPRQPTAYVNLP
jgi:outer membrane protein assembly factor BamB